MDPTPQPKKRTGRGLALKQPERAAIIAAHAAGLHEAELVRRTGRSRDAIRRVLQSDDAKKAKEMALGILLDGAGQLAADWLVASKNAAEKGDHTPALEALERLGIVQAAERKNEKPTQGFQIQLGVVLPGLPMAGQPTLTATALDGDLADE